MNDEGWIFRRHGADGQVHLELNIPDEWLPEGEDADVMRRQAQWMLAKMTSEDALAFVSELREALKAIVAEQGRGWRN